MNITSGLFFSGLLLFAFWGCDSGNSVTTNSKAVPVEDSAESADNTVILDTVTYHGGGRIVSVPPNKKQIIVKHSEIEGFMRAMTMPFDVPNPDMLEGLKAGDSVSIELDYDMVTVMLKELKKIK